MELKGEVSSTGRNAILYTRKPISGPVLGGLVRSKIEDADWVQAAFDGERIGFESHVRLWIKNGKNAEGLTVFFHDYPNDAERSFLPDTCIRWAEWRENFAVQGFASADDKLRYVRDEMPLRCVLRFYRSEKIGVDRLMDRTSAFLAGGVAFDKIDRPELSRQFWAFEFCGGDVFFRFSFSPGSVSNVSLERLIQEWLDAGRSLQSLPDRPPDDGFKIAYRESIWEQVARYGESH